MTESLQAAADAFTAAFDQAPVVLSRPVAAFLLQVLNAVQLPVAAENFEQQAALIVQAKKELTGDA